MSNRALRSHEQYRIAVARTSPKYQRTRDAGFLKLGKLLSGEWFEIRSARNGGGRSLYPDATSTWDELVAGGADRFDIEPLRTRKRMQASRVCSSKRGAVSICLHSCNQLGEHFARLARTVCAGFFQPTGSLVVGSFEPERILTKDHMSGLIAALAAVRHVLVRLEGALLWNVLFGQE